MKRYIRSSTLIADFGLENKSDEFYYQFLDRLKTDCKYFLGAGNYNEKHLWTKSVDNQIRLMREIYDMLDEKPEWLTKDDIDEFEHKMLTRPSKLRK